MPTSATGNRLRRDAGVTLVEALMALVIVGLVAGAVMLAVPGPDRAVRQEAERFAARVSLASDESVIANRTIALIVTHEGYGFERLEDNGWFPAEFGSPLGFRPWPRDIEARVEETVSHDTRVARFDAVGNATPMSVTMSGAGARWRVSIDGAGGAHVARAE